VGALCLRSHIRAPGCRPSGPGCLAKEDRIMALKERGAITGIGETAYSRNSGKSVVALQMQASLEAIADAGLSPTDIDGVIVYGPSGVVAEDFVTNFGIPHLPFSPPH